MAIYTGTARRKKIYVGSRKIKKVYVGSVKKYSAEETYTAEVTNYFKSTGDMNDLSANSAVSIHIPQGETFRLDSITVRQGIYTRLVASVVVNGTTVWSKDTTAGSATTHTGGPLPDAATFYTSEQDNNTIQINLRGAAINTSYSSGPKYTMTVQYTVGV